MFVKLIQSYPGQPRFVSRSKISSKKYILRLLARNGADWRIFDILQHRDYIFRGKWGRESFHNPTRYNSCFDAMRSTFSSVPSSVFALSHWTAPGLFRVTGPFRSWLLFESPPRGGQWSSGPRSAPGLSLKNIVSQSFLRVARFRSPGSSEFFSVANLLS